MPDNLAQSRVTEISEDLYEAKRSLIACGFSEKQALNLIIKPDSISEINWLLQNVVFLTPAFSHAVIAEIAMHAGLAGLDALKNTQANLLAQGFRITELVAILKSLRGAEKLISLHHHYAGLKECGVDRDQILRILLWSEDPSYLSSVDYVAQVLVNHGILSDQIAWFIAACPEKSLKEFVEQCAYLQKYFFGDDLKIMFSESNNVLQLIDEVRGLVREKIVIWAWIDDFHATALPLLKAPSPRTPLLTYVYDETPQAYTWPDSEEEYVSDGIKASKNNLQ